MYMTWGELKKFCEEQGVPDSAAVMVLKVHDTSIGWGDDGYDQAEGARYVIGNELLIE